MISSVRDKDIAEGIDRNRTLINKKVKLGLGRRATVAREASAEGSISGNRSDNPVWGHLLDEAATITRAISDIEVSGRIDRHASRGDYRLGRGDTVGATVSAARYRSDRISLPPARWRKQHPNQNHPVHPVIPLHFVLLRSVPRNQIAALLPPILAFQIGLRELGQNPFIAQ